MSAAGPLACLGPPPTFSHRAALARAQGRALLDVADIPALFAALAGGQAAAAMAPFHNSVAGPVAATIAALGLCARPLLVRGEIEVVVRFSLYRRAGDEAPLRRALSHAVSLAQCTRWLAAHGLEGEAVGSNGAAVAMLDAAPPGTGAIAPAGFAAPGRIEAASDLQGAQPNRTHFLELAPGEPPARVRRALLAGEAQARRFAPPMAPADLPGRALLLWLPAADAAD